MCFKREKMGFLVKNKRKFEGILVKKLNAGRNTCLFMPLCKQIFYKPNVLETMKRKETRVHATAQKVFLHSPIPSKCPMRWPKKGYVAGKMFLLGIKLNKTNIIIN